MLMFTMGAVAIARIAIEQNRVYSLGYAAALGGATFVVMTRFIGSPLFCAFILVVIACLADVIVRDCTIIDDDVDASGEGLIDAGRLYVKKQLDRDPAASAVPTTMRQHQPGRTVMYLAFGALPLFGLGQFMLHDDAASWTRAQILLGFYLFAALALLVTTSFLGLRRYLRQRNAEMPADVTVSWLAGGIAMIAAVLLVAYLVPLPGQALASIEIPEFIESKRDLSASRHGWGAEGADQIKQDAALTSDDESPEGKQVHSETMKEGGDAGDVGDGDREEGPAGKQTGGEKETSGSDSRTGGESKESKQESSGDSESKQQNAESEQKQSEIKSEKQGGEANTPPTDEQAQQPNQASESQSEQSQSSGADSVLETFSKLSSGLGSLLKLLIMLVLAAIVARFVWLNWSRFLHWIHSLLNTDAPQETKSFDAWEPDPATPPRPFSSYQNPIGNESDLRRVVVITFQAFEAWARERGSTREKDETPSEFVRRASQSITNVGSPASQVVDAYNRVVYGKGTVTKRDVDAANRVWQLMRSERRLSNRT